MSKAGLRKEFAKDWRKHYALDVLKEQGLERKRCPKCGKNFWTADAGRTLCGDQPCEQYSFLGNSPTKKPMDYIETWKEFEKFFVGNGHASMQRYPVVSRWRPDLFFTIASIQDFQRIEQGRLTFEYPASPLVLPQPCLRFNDIPNVGVTGRHHTCFNMIGQHSFNSPKEGYWKERCIELNFEWLTRGMGIDPKELVYIEDVWAMPDMSAFGPSIETYCRGLELVNSVFMQYTKQNGAVAELPMKVIDVGWGHERLAWISNGTPTSYDVVFGPVMDRLKAATGVEYDRELFMRYAGFAGSLNVDDALDIRAARKNIASQLGVEWTELEKRIAPLEAIYAIADHAKCLLFAISDGSLPSNTGGGYNLRVVARRALSLIAEYNFNFGLFDVAAMHADYLKKMNPDLSENLADVENVLDVETKRHADAKEKTWRIVSVLAEKMKKGYALTEEKLAELYDSNGITPELVAAAGVAVDLPPDFYARITERHGMHKAAAPKEAFDVAGIAPTEALYYSDVREFDATVVAVFKKSYVALDRTAFYPASGGQHSDHGKMNGCEVIGAEKHGAVVVHSVRGCGLKKGDSVHCVVDWQRRQQLTAHHTATHIVNAAARSVLGNHVNQAGAEKSAERARLDITHYELPTQEQLGEIERTANGIVRKNLKVAKTVLKRGEAEKKFGFRIYQGGAVPEKTLRIIAIEGIDTEACGGTHCDFTSQVGEIKIIRAERIQDGVVRLELIAGAAVERYATANRAVVRRVAADLNRMFSTDARLDEALEKTGDIDARIKSASTVLSVSPEQFAQAMLKFGREIVAREKTIKELSESLGAAYGSDAAAKAYGSIMNSIGELRLAEAAELLFEKWKGQGKELERLQRQHVFLQSKNLKNKIRDYALYDILDCTAEELVRLAENIVEENPKVMVVLADTGGSVVGMRGSQNNKNVGELVAGICKAAGGAGGGRESFGQGRAALAKLRNVFEEERKKL